MKNSIFIAALILCVQSFSYAQKSTSIVGPKKTVNPYHYTSVKSITFSKACVASAHPLASEVGAAIMKKGGNAFDAMIATQLTLAVVYPGAGNLGGGGFMIAHKKDGSSIALDYREMASSKASRDMYLDKDGNAQNQLSEIGHLSSGVPGTVAGLFATARYAKLPFAELIQPAIDLAEKGFVITAGEANGLNGNRADFIKYSTKPSAFVKEQEWKAGDTLVQPELAATLKRIRDNGLKGFYEGETAKLIAEEMQRGNGMVSLEDLKKYVVKERKVISFDYRGYQVISFPRQAVVVSYLHRCLK